jgi:hypothetical protein
VGTLDEVLSVLRGQYADQTPASEAQGDDISGEITLGDLSVWIDSFVEVNGPKPQGIIAAMRNRMPRQIN